MQDIMKLCDVVRQTGFELHRYLGGGMLEKVYENGLVHRLRKMGLKVEQQRPLQIFDEDGTLLGDYAADLFIEDILIGEVKAVRTYTDEHVAQILGYLRASRIEHGLLINFGTAKYQIKKYIWSASGHSEAP
jgi:GxxExxY protein